jgi:DHA2 family multidrug resistance protein
MKQALAYDPNLLVEYGYRRVIITITVVLCTLLEILDTTIVNVATTTLMGNLGATVSEISWVIAAYAIANVIIVPMSGWLSRQFGRKMYFAGSIALFTFSSLMCGLSHNIWVLVFWRFTQGIGGGALFATSQTILKEVYPPEKMGMAMAMFGMGVIIGPTLGPVIGGYLIDHYSWPTIFYVNIPVGIAAVFLTLNYIKNNPFDKPDKKGIDWIGIGLLIIGIGSLQMVLEQGERKDWFDSYFIVGFFVSAVVGIIGFIVWELTTDNPVVDLRILKKSNVAIGTIMNFILGFILFGSVFVYPIYLQRYLGFTAEQTGALFIPGAMTTGFLMPMIGMMLTKGVPPKFMIMFGFLINGFFAFWSSLIFTTNTGYETFLLPLLVRGVGMALLFVPLSNLTLGGLHGKDVGQASGLSNMVRQIGGSMSVALIGAFSERLIAQHRGDLLLNVTADNPLLRQRVTGFTGALSQHTSDVNAAAKQGYALLDFSISKQAAILSYIDIFQLMALAICLTVPIVLLARTYKVDPAAMAEAH